MAEDAGVGMSGAELQQYHNEKLHGSETKGVNERARPSVPHDSSSGRSSSSSSGRSNSSSSGGVVRRSDVSISSAELLCFGKERGTRGQWLVVR